MACGSSDITGVLFTADEVAVVTESVRVGTKSAVEDSCVGNAGEELDPSGTK